MKLIIMKGRATLCCKFLESNGRISYSIVGNMTEDTRIFVCDEHLILQLIKCEGFLPQIFTNIEKLGFIAVDSDTQIIAYGGCEIVPESTCKKLFQEYISLGSKQGQATISLAPTQQVKTKIEVKDVAEKVDNIIEIATKNVEIVKEIDELGIVSAEKVLENYSKDGTFYEEIKEQMDILFNIYPHNKQLESLVMDSKWVSVNYDENSIYVVGVISENNKAIVICYGVPQSQKTMPPKDIASYCEWLPVDRANIDGEGYYVLYQNALTGEILS